MLSEKQERLSVLIEIIERLPTRRQERNKSAGKSIYPLLNLDRTDRTDRT